MRFAVRRFLPLFACCAAYGFIPASAQATTLPAPTSLPDPFLVGSVQACSLGQCVRTSNFGSTASASESTPGVTASASYSLCCSTAVYASTTSQAAPPSYTNTGIATVSLTYYMEVLSTTPYDSVPVHVSATGSSSNNLESNFGGRLLDTSHASFQLSGPGIYIYVCSGGAYACGQQEQSSGFAVNQTLNLSTDVSYAVSITADAASVGGANGAGGQSGSSSTQSVDPTFTFGPGFDATGDSLLFSRGIINEPAVPELPTWAMMLIGLVGLGFVAYRRRNPSRCFAAA